jgi:hypothetical protein
VYSVAGWCLLPYRRETFLTKHKKDKNSKTTTTTTATTTTTTIQTKSKGL